MVIMIRGTMVAIAGNIVTVMIMIRNLMILIWIW